jgi:hypothetical protein
MLKGKKFDWQIAADFKKTFSRECKPHFVGLWDTVSSVGWVYNAVHFPFTTATRNPDFQLVRHAVSIDERRAFFRQNLFGTPMSPEQDVEEVWFAGVHSDVGGSYPEQESQLSKIALRWMVTEAEFVGLQINQSRKAEILGGEPSYATPDPLTQNQHESLKGLWWVAEVWPKVVHIEVSPQEWKRRLRINLGRRRYIQPNPFVHESVEQRIKNPATGYQPRNLPTERQIVHDRQFSQGASV